MRRATMLSTPKRVTLTAAAVLALAGGLVACSDTPACAAPTPTPFDALRTAGPPPAPSYRPPHRWGQPYGKPAQVPPPPTVTVVQDHEHCQPLREGNPAS